MTDEQAFLFGDQRPKPLAFQLTIWVDRETAGLIEKPINGQGGFQTLMTSLKANLRDLRQADGTRRLELTATQIDKIIRYAQAADGSGGFQGRLARLLVTLCELRDKLGGLP